MLKRHSILLVTSAFFDHTNYSKIVKTCVNCIKYSKNALAKNIVPMKPCDYIVKYEEKESNDWCWNCGAHLFN